MTCWLRRRGSVESWEGRVGDSHASEVVGVCVCVFSHVWLHVCVGFTVSGAGDSSIAIALIPTTRIPPHTSNSDTSVPPMVL
jgi:hypothetical protein